MMPPVLLLVPSDPLAPRRPDDHFAPEAAAAHDLGIAVALVDHDDLDRVHRVPESDDAVYRGWMVSSDQYAAFASALAARGTILRTSAAAYRTAHELPGWYPAFEEHTPHSVWTSGPSIEQLNDVTVDLVRRTDGAWRVVEVGDGQVSDRPSTTRPHALITAIARTQ